TEVERDATVTITFSADIDVSSVTPTSVRLVGPDGPVEDTLEISGPVVTLSPSNPLWLVGRYTVELGRQVAASDGAELGADSSSAFRVRDGRWQQPYYPFGADEERHFYWNPLPAENDRGDILIGGV